MPFRRRRFKRSRRPRRRMGSTRALAMRALRAVDEERKIHDLTALTTPNNSGEFHVLNGVSSGAAVGTRVGNQISCLNVQLKLHVTADPTLSTATVRAVLIVQKAPNGVAITPAQLLQNVTSGPLAMTTPVSIDAFKSIRVLRDWKIAYGLSQTTKVSSKFVRLKLKPRFTGLAGGIASINTGALLLFLYSDVAAGAGTPVVQLYSRLKFVG